MTTRFLVTLVLLVIPLRADAIGGKWTPISDAPTSAASHTAVWTGKEMIVWGGGTSGYRYDPPADTWTPISTVGAPAPRIDHTAVWTGKEIIIWGGGFPGLNTGARYNPTTNTWAPVSTANAPAGRRRHTAVWTGTEMIVWGGRTSPVFFFRDGGRYNPVTNTWTRILVLPNAPSGRADHVAVWTGDRMLVWGCRGDTTGVGYHELGTLS